MGKDYYKILGVNRDASQEDIKQAYRKLAHQYHPDRPNGSEDKFKEINEAYQVLSNQEKRSQYDHFGQVPNFDFGWDVSGFEDISDIFDSFFEGLGVRRRKTYHRGADAEMILPITLEEAFTGTEKEIKFTGLAACQSCNGAGHFAEEGFTPCLVCEGRGEIKETRATFFGNFAQIKTCQKCFGSGKIPNKTCSQCRGAGRLKQEKIIRVAVAPGVRNGQIIKLTGAGEAGERGANAGDLYVRIQIAPHSGFTVKGSDLVMDKEINIVDILLGKKIKVKVLSGKEIELDIPAGANLSQEFRVPGEGMPHFNPPSVGGARGDLYIRFNIQNPKKLSAKAKTILKDLRKELE